MKITSSSYFARWCASALLLAIVVSASDSSSSSSTKSKGKKTKQKGEDCGPDQAIRSVSSLADYNVLNLPEEFGETGVTWKVAFASQITQFEFTFPYADDDDLEEMETLIQGIESQDPVINQESFLSELTISSDMASSLCPDIPTTVEVTLPRSVQGLCIGDICRPVLCSLGPEFLTKRDVTEVSFAPGNTELFFGSSIDCEIVAPLDWDAYVLNEIGEDTAILGSEFWLYQDLDADGASNIVEYYGIPMISFFSETDTEEVQPQSNSSSLRPDNFLDSGGRSLRSYGRRLTYPFTSDPLDPDTDEDLLLDGYELLYGLDPSTFNDISEDADGDGLTVFEEQIYRTNPFVVDTDGDGVDDNTEIVDGTSPLDDRDFLDQTTRSLQRESLRAIQESDECKDKTVDITLTIGDPSGSRSERYAMVISNWGEHSATEFGEVAVKTYPFTAGTYQVRVKHVKSKLSTPDYDYRASITYAPSSDWTITITDPDVLLTTSYLSSIDRTIGLVATLSIVRNDAQCSYATCFDCRSDDKCYWDDDKKACKKRSCAFFGSAYNDKPEECFCEVCKSWAAKERGENGNGLDWIKTLPKCPCTTVNSAFDGDWAPGTWDVDKFCNPKKDCSENHPGATGCIRQYVGVYGNQCCYDSAGRIITSGRGAGTPDKAPKSFSWTHYKQDKVPYDNCCLKCEIQSVCNEYIGGDGIVGARQDTRDCVNI